MPPFCISASQYEEDIHQIVSGPFDTCQGCDPLPKGIENPRSFFEIKLTNQPLSLELPSEEYLFFHIEDPTTSSLTIRLLSQPNTEYLAAKVTLGVETYNPSWNFHLKDIRIIPVSELLNNNRELLDLLPSAIEEKIFLGQIQNGQEVFFSTEKIREMSVGGVFSCEHPLVWSCSPSLANNGFYRQSGTCIGECQSKAFEGSVGFCLDGYISDALNELNEELDDIESGLDPFEIPSAEEMSENLYISELTEEEIQISEDVKFHQSLSLVYETYEDDRELEDEV